MGFIMYENIILNLEASSFIETELTIVCDDEITEELSDALEESKIPFIVDKNSKLGQHIDMHHGKNMNAIVDGVYIPELDTSRGIGKRVRVITSESMNESAGDVDAYLVDDEEIAESLESNGKVVLRNISELKLFVRS